MALFRTTRFALFLFAILGLTLPAYARPANSAGPISAGSITLDRHIGFGLGGDAELVINDIVIRGTMFNFAVTPDCNHGGAVCLRGTQVRLPTTHITEDGFNLGSVTINGHTVNQVYYLGGFNFVSPAVTIPHASAVMGTLAVRAPFSVSGELLGCLTPMPSGFCGQADTVFSTPFAGNGTVTYRLRAMKGTDFANTVSRYSYDLVSVNLQFGG
jgi:hypothetical protein